MTSRLGGLAWGISMLPRIPETARPAIIGVLIGRRLHYTVLGVGLSRQRPDAVINSADRANRGSTHATP